MQTQMLCCKECEKRIEEQILFLKQMQAYKDRYAYTIKHNQDYDKVIISIAYMTFFGILMQFGKLVSIEWLRVIIILFILSLFIFVLDEIIAMCGRSKETEKFNELMSTQDLNLFNEKKSEYEADIHKRRYDKYKSLYYHFAFQSTTIWGLTAGIIFMLILIIKTMYF